MGEIIRTHLAESQDVMRDLQERLRATQEEAEMQAKRRGEMERLLSRRDAAYEELLGEIIHAALFAGGDMRQQTRHHLVSRWLPRTSRSVHAFAFESP